MKISMIAAMDCNFLIGRSGELPWEKLSSDMRRFRGITMGKPVVMGRKTFNSIGKPLDGRINVVLTKDPRLESELGKKGCLVFRSVDEVLRGIPKTEELVVIGGESVYRQFLPLTDRLYLTFVRTVFEKGGTGDAYFPAVDFSKWNKTEEERISADEKTPYELLFQAYEKK